LSAAACKAEEEAGSVTGPRIDEGAGDLPARSFSDDQAGRVTTPEAVRCDRPGDNWL